jgi:imidazolonepropionase-like amidohydrolase
MTIHRRLAAALAVLAVMPALGKATFAGPPGCTLAIIHANVIPMDTERVLADQTVAIAGDRIVSIGGPARCSRTIDAKGRYLVPGLNDMHVHVETVALAQSFGVASAPIDYPAVLALYIANGVTGIRVMSGAPDILAFRNSQRGKASPYPRLVVATPMLAGTPPILPEPITKVLRTPDEARAAIRQYARDGYDFVKVRENLPAPVFTAVIDEARKVGLYVDGHISQGQGLSVFDVLRSGQKAIAHLDNLQLMITDKARDPQTYIQLLHACDCFVETTMQVEKTAVAQLTDFPALLARPGMKYMHPLAVKAFWLPPNNPYLKEKGDPKFFLGLYADEKVLLKTFIDAGVHVVAGTDALNPMIIPGESLHDELASMVEAGLTPYQALQTATTNPAAYVPGFADVGVLAPGRAANALLVDANPLNNIAALDSPEAVMINGHWLPREELHRILESSAAEFRAP